MSVQPDFESERTHVLSCCGSFIASTQCCSLQQVGILGSIEDLDQERDAPDPHENVHKTMIEFLHIIMRKCIYVAITTNVPC